MEKNFPYKGIDKTEEVVIRGKCSPAISGSEYETEHSPTAKFSTETIIPLYSKLLGTEGSNRSPPVSPKTVPHVIRSGLHNLQILLYYQSKGP